MFIRFRFSLMKMLKIRYPKTSNSTYDKLTLNEFTIAYDEKKTIGLLKGTGGLCDDKSIEDFVKASGKWSGEIVSDTNPAKLVEKLLEKL